MKYYRVAYKYKYAEMYREANFIYQSPASAKRRAKKMLEECTDIENTVVTEVLDECLYREIAKYERSLK